MIKLNQKELFDVSGGCYRCDGNYGSKVVSNRQECIIHQCRTVDDIEYRFNEFGLRGMPGLETWYPCENAREELEAESLMYSFQPVILGVMIPPARSL